MMVKLMWTPARELALFCVALMGLGIILTLAGTGAAGGAVILAVTVLYGVTLGVRVWLTR